MIRLALASLAGGIALAATSPASASFPYTKEMTCAVGGETFKHKTTGSYSVWGRRPDGKPYGSWSFPLAIPECPGNGLLMYRKFDDAELERLEELIERSEYRELDETPYYRAQWLEDRLLGKETPPWLLMRAIWESDREPETRGRYLAEFATRVEALPLDLKDRESVYLRFLLANAYRELGRFEEALAVLDTIPLASLPDSDKDWTYLRERIALLGDVTRDGETTSHPLRLIPESAAAFECKRAMDKGKDPIDPFCETDAMKALVAKQYEREKR